MAERQPETLLSYYKIVAPPFTVEVAVRLILHAYNSSLKTMQHLKRR